MDIFFWLMRYWMGFVVIIVSIFSLLYLGAATFDFFLWIRKIGKAQK